MGFFGIASSLSGMEQVPLNMHLSKRFGRPAKRVSRILRRLRKVSVRRISETLPGVSMQWQRMRYRQWIAKNAHEARNAGLTRPDFIIIGAPKCGTSWLQGGLAQHPNIIAVPEEIEYFSLHSDYPVEWYSHHFAEQLNATRDTKQAPFFFGEKSARYCTMSPENIRRARDLVPEARLILMTRDPVSRHWAHAKKFFAKRRLINPDQAVLSIPGHKLLDFFREMRSLGEFSKIIANWTAVYPKGQLLILSQEKTLTSPQPVIDAVLEHIGISSGYDPESLDFLTKQRNRGPKIEMPGEIAEFLEEMFAGEREWLRAFFGDRLYVRVS